MLTRIVSAAGAVTVMLLSVAGPAVADGLVLDGTTVKATADGHDYTADVAVINATDTAQTLPATVAITPTCGATVTNRLIAAHTSATATLRFDQSCFGSASSIMVDLDGAGPMPKVTIKKPAEKDSDWAPMRLALGVALCAAAVVAIGGFLMLRKAGQGYADDAQRSKAFAELKSLVDARTQAFAPPVTLPWKDLPDASKYGPRSEVRGLEAGWSFKDSWAANLTLVTTALVALVNSTDTLKAVTGKDTDTALGVMTVAGLIAAVVVAIANTVVKLFGPDAVTVTTSGLIVSTALVVFAASFQAVTVGAAAHDLATGDRARGIVTALTVLVGLVLLVYAGATLHTTLNRGVPDAAVPGPHADALTAWAIDTDEDVAWQQKLVLHQLETAYQDLIDEDAVPALQVPGYELVPMMVGATSPGDDRAPRASLI